MFRVVLYALTMPPSPMLYQDFPTKAEAERWRTWASCLPCHARISRKEQP